MHFSCNVLSNPPRFMLEHLRNYVVGLNIPDSFVFRLFLKPPYYQK